MEMRTRDGEKKINGKQNMAFEEKEQQTIPKLIRHFWGYTTAHGMNRLGEAKGLFWKIFWSVICLGAFGMFTFQAHGLFTLYYSRPQVPFPAVTICNLNMIRNNAVPKTLKKEIAKTYQNYNASEDLGKIRQRRGISTKAPFEPLSTFRQTTTSRPKSRTTSRPKFRTTSRLKSRTTPKRYPSSNPTSWYDKDKNDGYYGYYGKKPIKYYDKELLPAVDEVDTNVLFLERFTTIVTRVPEVKLKNSGHQFEDFVTNCTWRGYGCKTGNFSKWWYQSWNYKYGNCFTFNGGKDGENNELRVLSTSKPGPTQGLLLQLDIQQEEYLETISSEAGIRVILHDQGVMPFPFEEGFSVSPGMSTSVGIQKTVITRVDRFGNNSCWNINELDSENIYRVYNNITKYTRQTCENSCLGKTQFEECGCSEYVYPSSSPACDAFNETIRACLSIVHIKFNNNLLPCYEECRQPCSEDIIQKTISMSQWPSINYERNRKKSNKTFSGKSALVLNIFYNELNYVRIEEMFTYDLINLLADIGGQLGLWIGVSAITCVEVFELFVLIAVQVVRKFQKKDHARNMVLP